MSRALVLLALLTTCLPPLLARTGKPPVAVFQELEGRWQGSFVGYDATGKELYRLEATHTYRTLDATIQSVTIEDRTADGTVVRTTGTHVARRTERGDLVIACDLTRSNGERVQHQGRLIRGPLGNPEFIWYSSGGQRSETFRESVTADGESRVYQIDGMGRYGDQLILMAGRYRRVGD